VRSFEKIFWNYFYGAMLFELIPLLPLPMLNLPINMQSKFYVLKTIRTLKGTKQLNVSKFMKGVKEFYKNRLIDLQKENPELANDSTVDNTKMKDIIFISLTLKTLKLILMIFNFSFFIGMGWLLLCITLEEFN
jgi:hypothetical protein